MGVIREQLAELYEAAEEWSKAAHALAGIDLDSGVQGGLNLPSLVHEYAIYLVLARAVDFSLVPVQLRLVHGSCRVQGWQSTHSSCRWLPSATVPAFAPKRTISFSLTVSARREATQRRHAALDWPPWLSSHPNLLAFVYLQA